jgi:hypothetical protein
MVPAGKGGESPGTETTPAKLELYPAVWIITPRRNQIMATKPKKKKKMKKT